MQRAIMLLAALSVAIPASSIVPAAVAAEPVLGVKEFCETEILPDPQFASATLGECIAYNQTFFNSHTGGFAAQECNYFLEVDPVKFYEWFDSYADCIRSYR